MSRTHRLAALTLAATLLAVPASASPGFGEGGSPGFADWLQQSWSWLAGWWTGGQEKHRCDIDPNGGPCVPAPTAAKAGCDVDPDGCARPVYTLEPDLGCGIDPDGGPCLAAPRATEKHGCGIDPDGKPCAPKP